MRSRALSVAALLLVLVLAVPWRGYFDGINSPEAVPPPAAAENYDASARTLLQRGEWWRMEPDYSALQVMHRGFAESRDFRGLLYTLGPWGFLYKGYDPATYYWTIAGWMLLVAAFWWGSADLTREMPPAMQALWWAALLSLLGAYSRELLVLLLAPLLIVSTARKNDQQPPSEIAVAVALALASWIKLSSLLMNVLVVAILAGADVLRHRRVPRFAVAYLVALVAFWIAAGQPLTGLPGYLRALLEITAGYTEGASREPDSHLTTMTAVIFAALIFAAALKLWRKPAPLHIAAASLAGLALIKAGLVRHDPVHDFLSSFAMAGFGLFLLPEMAVRFPKRRAAIVALFAVFVCVQAAPLWPSAYAAGEQIVAALNPVRQKMRSDAQHASDVVRIRTNYPIPPLRGGADLFTIRQSILLASGTEYRPRPLFQSYVAWSPALSQRNAAFLRSDDAPEWVLAEVWAVDEHLPAVEDARAWPELLARYDAVARAPTMVLMRRSRAPRTVQLRPLATVDAKWGERADLPRSSHPLWVKMELAPTLAGRLVSFVYKGPEVRVNLSVEGGGEPGYRLIPAAAADGFLLSPIIEDPGTLQALDGGVVPPALRVRALTLHQKHAYIPVESYGPTVRMRISEVIFAP
jgi:hypothetical protein